MNKRIDELAEQATETSTSYFDGRGNVTETYFDKDKFAELIIRECIERIKRVGILEDIENETDMVVDAVKEHFGVE